MEVGRAGEAAKIGGKVGLQKQEWKRKGRDIREVRKVDGVAKVSMGRENKKRGSRLGN